VQPVPGAHDPHGFSTTLRCRAARYGRPHDRIDLNDDGASSSSASGAGGGTLAHELTAVASRVVLLEAGNASHCLFPQVPVRLDS